VLVEHIQALHIGEREVLNVGGLRNSSLHGLPSRGVADANAVQDFVKSLAGLSLRFLFLLQRLLAQLQRNRQVSDAKSKGKAYVMI